MPKILLLCLFLTASRVAAQSNNNSFTVEGRINTDTGTIHLWPYPTCEYLPDHSQGFAAHIVNGHFMLTGSLQCPAAFIAILDTRYVSGIFYIDPGSQKMTCNIDSLRETPALYNSTMQEFRQDYLPITYGVNAAYNHVRERADSLKSIYETLPVQLSAKLDSERSDIHIEFDRLFFQYAKTHHDSFIVLWQTAMMLASGSGYRPVLDSIYREIADAVKQTQTGKILGKNLYAARVTAIGSKFPQLTLLTDQNEKVAFPLVRPSDKYVLIDFWFSHCLPCISQFPGLKKVYADYKEKGFNILGVSTDQTSFREDWKSVIKDNALPWPQYLDENGLSAHALSIVLAPSNFLLDRQGIIIQKNISVDQLASFLNTAPL